MCSAPASRLRRIYLQRIRLPAVLSLLFAFFIVLLETLPLLPVYPQLIATIKNMPAGIISLYQGEPLKILKTAMPVLEWSSFEGESDQRTSFQIALGAVGAISGVSLYSPASLLESQIPLLAFVDYPEAVVVTGDNYAEDIGQPMATSSLLGEALVCVYNTHTGETYVQTDGVERLDGKHGGVVTVAAALQDALENKYKIKVARSDRINDYIYNNSYVESGKTAKELVSANPNARMVLDIHRDSGKTRDQSIVKINGLEAAPILFVVGSETRRPFPNWRQNHAFASELSNKTNEMYHGLSLGVRVKDGLYNQNLHPHAVLVEIGTSVNSTGEAVQSARLLADVIAWYINNHN